MVFTHVLIGLLFGAVVSTALPEFTAVAIAGGILGGLFPDLDMMWVHRRTLHYPVVAAVAAAVLTPLALLFPSAPLAFLCAFAAAMAAHCLMDVLGGGKEMRPWRETDDRAVYNHVSDEWVRPLRVMYAGSRRDLSVSLLAALGALLLLPGGYWPVVAVLIASAVVYTVIRRWITRRISEEYPTFSSYIQQKTRATWRRLM
jgi:membrane protein implicated in regulation of membrane protease activity